MTLMRECAGFRSFNVRVLNIFYLTPARPGVTWRNKLPELNAKKMDETNALPEPALKLSKMTIMCS